MDTYAWSFFGLSEYTMSFNDSKHSDQKERRERKTGRKNQVSASSPLSMVRSPGINKARVSQLARESPITSERSTLITFR